MRSWKSWKIWQKLHFGLHTSSDPSGQHNSLHPSPRASSKERAVCVPDSDDTAPIETSITPSLALLATTPQFPISSSDGSSSQVESIPGWKHTAYAGTKIALEVVRESSDMFLPLKGVVGGLTALLKHYDVSGYPIRTTRILLTAQVAIYLQQGRHTKAGHSR